MSESQRVYKILSDFNPKCSACSLSNNLAIGGHTFGKVSEVELIIIAAYPAREEIKKGYSLASNQRRKNIDKPNAGRYVQYSILSTFENDSRFPEELKPFYDRIAFSNMIKCSPFNKTGDKLDVTDKHIRTCKTIWLEKEIREISKYNPTCPILLCGSEAVKLMGPKMKVYSNRRKKFIYDNTHPVLCTFNPVEVVRYTAYEITKSKINRKGLLMVDEVRPKKPIIVGSTTWHWKQDIETMKNLVLENYNNRRGKKVSGYKKMMEYYS